MNQLLLRKKQPLNIKAEFYMQEVEYESGKRERWESAKEMARFVLKITANLTK